MSLAYWMQCCWNDLCCTGGVVEERRARLRFWLYTSLYLVLRQVAAILQANKSLENDTRTRALDLKIFSLFPFSFPANLLLHTTAQTTSRLITHALSGNSLLSLAKNRISYFVSATRINCAKNLAWLIVGLFCRKRHAYIYIYVSCVIFLFFLSYPPLWCMHMLYNICMYT